MRISHIAWSCLYVATYLLQFYCCSLTAGASLCLLHKRKWTAKSCSFFLPSHNFSLLNHYSDHSVSYNNYLGKWRANQNMLINLTYEDGIKISELKNMETNFSLKIVFLFVFLNKLIVIRPLLTASIKVKQNINHLWREI